MPITDIFKTGRIPYNYTVGTPDSGKPLPFDVKVSIDKDLKKSIDKWIALAAAGIGLGIAAGIVISKVRRK